MLVTELNLFTSYIFLLRHTVKSIIQYLHIPRPFSFNKHNNSELGKQIIIPSALISHYGKENKHLTRKDKSVIVFNGLSIAAFTWIVDS